MKLALNDVISIKLPVKLSKLDVGKTYKVMKIGKTSNQDVYFFTISKNNKIHVSHYADDVDTMIGKEITKL